MPNKICKKYIKKINSSIFHLNYIYLKSGYILGTEVFKNFQQNYNVNIFDNDIKTIKGRVQFVQLQSQLNVFLKCIVYCKFVMLFFTQ